MNKDKRNNIQLLGTLNNADESGIIANANQIYDANEDKSTQDVSKEHKDRIETLETKESSMQTTLENISKTGEASAASNVTYNHSDSKLDATNVQQAIDEVLDLKANVDDVRATTDDIYKKSNYNDGDNIIDFNTIHIITDNPEFVCVAVDVNEKILYGIKTDGQLYFGVGCPQQVKDYVDEQINKILGTDDITTTIDSLKEIETFLRDFTNSDTLKALLDTKANKTDVDNTVANINADIADKYRKSNPNDEEGNVIDTNSIKSVINNPEYFKAFVDNTNKLIEAISLDGIRKFFAGINIQGILQCVTDNPEYSIAWVDKENRIIFAIQHDGNPYFGYGVPKDVDAAIASAIAANIERIIGVNADFSEIGFYSNGDKNTNSDSRSTVKIPTTGAQEIKYRLQLNKLGQIISFFDANDNFLSDISITATDKWSSVLQEGTIDLTDSTYANVAYVAFSCYQYSAEFYALVGKVNNIQGQIKELNKELNETKPFLYGKKFCALGDSITDGDGNSSYSWYDMLLERYGATADSLNFAETGQCLRTMADLCTAENMANIDICFVAGGTNQLSNYRLGTIDDDPTPDRWEPNKAYSVGDKVLGGTMERHGWTTNIMAYLYWYECVTAGTSGNTADASGFNHTVDSITTDGTVEWKCIGNPSWYSDMKGICRRVWGFNPKIQIVWIVPIKTKYDADNNVPETFRQAEKFQAIRDFCKGYSIRMIDLQREFPLNTWTKDAIMADNLHPNSAGYKIIQDIVCSHIE